MHLYITCLPSHHLGIVPYLASWLIACNSPADTASPTPANAGALLNLAMSHSRSQLAQQQPHDHDSDSKHQQLYDRFETPTKPPRSSQYVSSLTDALSMPPPPGAGSRCGGTNPTAPQQGHYNLSLFGHQAFSASQDSKSGSSSSSSSTVANAPMPFAAASSASSSFSFSGPAPASRSSQMQQSQSDQVSIRFQPLSASI